MSEWHRIGPTTLQRRLRGTELLVNHAEHHQEGNFQLFITAPFETNVPIEDLRKRLYSAWYQVRQKHPVIAVKVCSSKDSNLDFATFQAVNDEHEFTLWAKETCFIVDDGRSLEDIRSNFIKTQLTTPGKQACLTLVTSPRVGPVGLTLQVTHVLNSQNILRIMETVAEELIKQDSTPSVPFEREIIEAVRTKLPRSSIDAYKDQFKPSKDDVDSAQIIAARAAQRYAKNTIGIPILNDWRKRQSNVRNLKFVLDAQETKAITQTLKRLQLTLTSAFYACICAAIAQLRSPSGEEGAHLLFSASVKRWLPTEGENGSAPIPMGIVPGGAWIDANEQEFRAKDLDGLIILARKITNAQEEDITSPHILNFYDEMAESVRSNGGYPASAEPLPLARPVYTSQGLHFLKPNIPIDDKSGSWFRFTDYTFGSRNTDPVVCFASNIFAKELRYYLLFDEKYFDLEETHALAIRVGSLLHLFAMPASNL